MGPLVALLAASWLAGCDDGVSTPPDELRPDEDADELSQPLDVDAELDDADGDAALDLEAESDAELATDWVDDGDSPEAGDGTDESDVLPPPPPIDSAALVGGVDPLMWEHLDTLAFELAPKHEITLYLALLDANFFHRTERRALGALVLGNPESFVANVVEPLARRYDGAASVWAIDCLNEPEAMIAGVEGNWTDQGLDWPTMRGYLGACAAGVERISSIPVSAGSGWHGPTNLQAGRYDGLGFDFYDFHLYSDQPSVPTLAELGLDRPVLIGECGQFSTMRDDALQLAATRACFEQARDAGYLGALSWAYEYAGNPDHLAHLDDTGAWRPVVEVFDMNDGNFVAGLNLAWFAGQYDHDLGPNLLHPSWGVGWNEAVVDAALAQMAAAGVTVLRVWLFEGMEGLHFHSVWEDFDTVEGRWERAGDGIAIARSDAWSHDGQQSLAIEVDASVAGWVGVRMAWPLEAPLNLAHAQTWEYTAHSELDAAVGINLAMRAQGQLLQTRPSSAQLWLMPGETGSKRVPLDAASFVENWALDSAPSVGVARPSEAAMSAVEELVVRFYVGPEQVPLRGTLYLDAIRVR